VYPAAGIYLGCPAGGRWNRNTGRFAAAAGVWRSGQTLQRCRSPPVSPDRDRPVCPDLADGPQAGDQI